jgi:hypothetical protein
MSQELGERWRCEGDLVGRALLAIADRGNLRQNGPLKQGDGT